MAQSWEADKMLDVYIHDYLTKRNLQNSAKAFFAEGKVSPDPVAIDAPGGFLFEWWSVFWDIFISRTNEKHSEVAAAYTETQKFKAREQQPQSLHQMQLLRQQQQQQLQQQQLQLQQQQQQQHQQQNAQQARPLMNNGTPTSNVMVKYYEDKLKQDEPSLKRYGDTSLDPNQDIKPSVAPPGSTGIQARQQQDNKNDVHLLNQRSPATDPALFNMKGGIMAPGANTNQPSNLLGQKSWPSSLAGMDQRLIQQQQKPFLQSSSHAYQQLHGLTPHQQQLLFQAQPQHQPQQIPSPAVVDVDPRRFKMLLNNRKDGQGNVFSDPAAAAVIGSPMQAASPLSRATSQDQELIKMKVMQQQQQQSNKMNIHQNNQTTPQQVTATDAAIQLYGSIEPTRSNNSTKTRSQGVRKRKQPASSSGPANSTGTGNTAGRSPNSPSTPSTHTPGDVMSMGGAMHQSNSISKSLMMYGSDHGTLTSPSNQLADIDRLEDGLDDNVESFLSHEETDTRDGLFSSIKPSPKGFAFNEVCCLRASTSKVVCCHFSSSGKLLASAGHEKKAVLWNMDTLKLRSTLEEHSYLITDVRFSPNSTRLATSSFDKTVRVWDADNPSYSLRTFTGHQATVMSLDFHPANEDLLCSCDSDSEIRYWSVSQGICTKVFKGGATQMRFQPRHGRLLAAAAENVVSIFDVDAETCRHSLQRHTKPVHSVCWDINGDYLASVSEDSVRVWTLRSGGDGECVHELCSNGNKFHSCVFHPSYPNLLIIGCYESLELWNMVENKSMTIPAHQGLIAALAQSPATGMVASASHDKCVKVWR